HYSKSYLSKVETGVKAGSADLARQCDAALSSGGALIRLAASGHTSDSHRLQDEVDEVRILTLDTDGDDRFGVLGRRPLLVGSTATVAAWASSSTSSRDPAGALPTKNAELVLTSFIAIFDQLRQLGQWLSPGLLVPQLATQVHALRNLAVRSMPA